MKKKILFFKLILEENKQLNLFEPHDSTLQDKIDRFCQMQDSSELVQVLDKKVFQIISIDREHIFGTFGKTDDIQQGDTIRGRNRENYEVENIHSLIESFTYFYTNLNTNYIALINKSGLPDFKRAFSQFISSHFRVSSLFNAKVVPYMCENIENRLGKQTEIAKIKITYATNQIPSNEFASSKEIFNLANEDVQNATLNLTIRTGVQKDLSKFPLLNKKIYENITIENNNETIDILNGLITEKLTIEINDSDMQNKEKIKNILSSSLANIF